MSRTFCTIGFVLSVACLAVGLQTVNAAPIVLASHTGNADPTTEGWTKVDRGLGAQAQAWTTYEGNEPCWSIWTPTSTDNTRYVASSMTLAAMSAIRAGGYSAKVRFEDRNGDAQANATQTIQISDGTREYVVGLGSITLGGIEHEQVYLFGGDNGGLFTASQTVSGTAADVEVRVAPGASVADVYLNGTLASAGWTGQDSTVGDDPFYFGYAGSGGVRTCFYVSTSFTALNQVPEPSSIALLVSGLFGLLAYAWRKRK